jgi:putative transposase
MQLAALICWGCSTPAELTAKLKYLFSGVLEKMLEAEMDEHLGYEKHNVPGKSSSQQMPLFRAEDQP